MLQWAFFQDKNIVLPGKKKEKETQKQEQTKKTLHNVLLSTTATFLCSQYWPF